MSDNIPPFEIQIEIIKRVPVKSVVRFRSVSKSWRSLIDSSEFISGYRARKTQPRSLLVRYKDDYKSPIKYLSVNDDDTFTQQQDLTPNVSVLMKPITSFLHFIACSRGLLCLYTPLVKGGLLILWNPSIRRSVGILGFPDIYCLFGFAVCHVTNEPTFVKISTPWKVGVFTLSSKKWTVIQCIKPREFISLHGNSNVVIDSCIYRGAYESICRQNGGFTKQYMIVSFDLNAKEFKAIDLPDTITNLFSQSSLVHFIISKLKGSLVVIVPHREIREIKVWKMEPDCSFTQLFTINTLQSLTLRNILGFRKNGELVVETRETPGPGELVSFGLIGTFDDMNSALAVYDPCSKQITNLGMSGRIGSFFISSYKETLLLLDHSDSCEYPEIN